MIAGIGDLQKSNVMPIALLRKNHGNTTGVQQKRAGSLGLRRLQHDV